jgi:steroid delta-isomerase-like uncharacterized protein
MESSNRDTARAFLEAAFSNDRDTSRQLIAEGYTYIDRTQGDSALAPERLQETVQEYHGAWSDQQMEIEHIMDATDGTVIAQYRLTATHTGTYRSVPATGRRATTSYCEIFRFDAGGRILVEEAYYDALGRMQQLGAVLRVDDG